MIVGKFLGKNALAAVGSSFALMTFLTSILLGLCMGSGAAISIRFGRRDARAVRESVCASFALTAALTLALSALAALPGVGVTGIWWSVPIGWLLADIVGLGYYALKHSRQE